MGIAIAICSTILTIISILYTYRSIFTIIGLFSTKKFSPAKKQHRYGILIAARNEETVLPLLLESIQKQTYPHDLLSVFVVADNCTDSTAKIAREYGADCIERHDKEKRTKGYALQYLFEHIEKKHGITSFDGYFIFDADNLLSENYIEKMNDAFDSGERIITSYRNSKNFADNAISASYAFHWLRCARLENRGRSLLGFPIRIQGTGFLFDSDFVKDGWKYTSLTEDRAFMSEATVRRIRITYQHEALFYDEQPTSLKIAMRQRLRWAKGHLLAFKETLVPLFKNLFGGSMRSRLASFDMILLNLPRIVPTLTLTLALLVLNGIISPATILPSAIPLFTKHIALIPMAVFLCISERKMLPRVNIFKIIWLCISFSMFDFIGDISIFRALFKRVEWDPIPHDAAISIEELEHDQ